MPQRQCRQSKSNPWKKPAKTTSMTVVVAVMVRVAMNHGASSPGAKAARKVMPAVVAAAKVEVMVGVGVAVAEEVAVSVQLRACASVLMRKASP